MIMRAVIMHAVIMHAVVIDHRLRIPTRPGRSAAGFRRTRLFGDGVGG